MTGSAVVLLGGAIHSLAKVSPWLLGLALALHLVKVAAEARAWHGIVRGAHDGSPLAFRTTLGAFVGSIGANAVLPARVGEAFRVGVVRRHAKGSSVSTLGGTIALETLLELGFAAFILFVLLSAGRSVGPLGAPLSALVSHPAVALAIAAGLAAGVVLLLAVRSRAVRFARDVVQGFAVVKEPLALGRVVGWKAVAWTMRTASVVAFLAAFGLPLSLWTAVLVIAAQTAAAIVPFTPGNAGTQQAALVVALAGTTSASTALGFGVGMQGATLVTDLAVGTCAVALVAGLGDLRTALPSLWGRQGAPAVK